MPSLSYEKQSLGTVYTKGEPILKINISQYGYGDKVVLRNIHLLEYDTLRPGYITGQSIAILGRSGRGKSTLFRLISGLETSNTVEVVIIGENGPCHTREGLVGMIDQKYTLFRHMTVKQILRFAASRNKEIDMKLVDDYIMDVASTWDLLNTLNKYPFELSGGQKQRTAILEKIFLGNHYMILDEPISGLDVVAIQNVKNNFNHIMQAHEHNTIIFSTHDLAFAYEQADSIWVIGEKDDVPGSTIISNFDRRYGQFYTLEDVETAVKYS